MTKIFILGNVWVHYIRDEGEYDRLDCCLDVTGRKTKPYDEQKMINPISCNTELSNAADATYALDQISSDWASQLR